MDKHVSTNMEINEERNRAVNREVNRTGSEGVYDSMKPDSGENRNSGANYPMGGSSGHEKKEKMKIGKKSFVALMIVIFMLGAGAGLGVSNLSMLRSSTQDTEQSVNARDKKLEELYSIINRMYYKEPNQKDMEEGIYKGLFLGLGDKYSSYMTKEEYQSYETSVTGQFEGIGITFQENKKGEYVIISTVKGSPAEKAGFKPKDVILKVDGKEYDNVDKMAAAIKGRKGTQVKLTIKRKDKEKTISVIRDEIVMETVEHKMLDKKTGYIKIISFESNTARDYEKAFEDLEKKNMKSFILDLRDNGGGLVDQAVDITDTLLSKSVITYMEDRNGKRDYYRSDESCTQLPYVILVNENTASASEIMTAAVKDKGKGKIVGQKTYGKGVVQVSNSLPDGSGYKITVMQYFSPNGNRINNKGVTPDYKVKGKKQQLERAEKLLKNAK